MTSPDYPGSNLTQAQNGVNLPLVPNHDIQGYAVRLSSFIAHLCVALLIAYSTKTQRHFYLPLLSQVALAIFAVWLCGRNQLNFSDIEFAVIQTRSPVSIYILLLVIPRLLFQRPTFKKKDTTSKSHDGQSFFRGMINSESLDWALIRHRAWGLLYLSCCLSVNLVRQFNKARYNGFTQAARDMFADPISPPKLRLEGWLDSGKVWLGLAICSAFVYECVLHRHGEQRRRIMHQLAGKRKKSLKAWALSKRVRWGFAATWFIATKLHPWLPFLYASVMFLNWSRDMKIWTIEENFNWTYGQLLAISQVIITLYPCWQLCYSRWWEIVPLPRRLVFDIIWLISGKGQPWTNPTESDLILGNLWDAFPPDVTPEEIGLPTAKPALPLDVTNPFPAEGTSIRSMRSRHRQNRTNWGPRSEQVTGSIEEEDIADQVSN
ncbi:hypothetical protein M378DRAFT_908676 [Amanita muscaria Koide BX008]|uniref:Uncharacterized protein n=1 Tax=Amanita muscaria (strain Koide BX008) TaxID=946122 RepID=A0A0C2WWS5_AMAMK|nr:hypothetical protein M378DRAFT_908676 [Amanita muscaria Koide BX008]